jgi:hypothetical protein
MFTDKPSTVIVEPVKIFAIPASPGKIGCPRVFYKTAIGKS